MRRPAQLARAAQVCVAVTVALLGYWTWQGIRLDVVAPESHATIASAGFPRRVDVGTGEPFEVAAKPVRIVASSARLIDFCAALVAPERIAGYPEQALEYTTLGDREAEFASRPRFREYLAEPVMLLSPDLVLADPWQSLDTATRLRDAGVPVLVLEDAHEFAAIRRMLLVLGEVLGEEATASDVVADLDARVARLERAAPARPLRIVPYANFGTQGFSAGSGTTIDTAIRLAGLRNALAEEGVTGHQQINFEALLVLDPDAIVLSQPLATEEAHAGDRGGAAERILYGESSLAGLRAVKRRAFLRLDAGLYASASHGIVRAAEELQRQAATLAAALEEHP